MGMITHTQVGATARHVSGGHKLVTPMIQQIRGREQKMASGG